MTPAERDVYAAVRQLCGDAGERVGIAEFCAHSGAPEITVKRALKSLARRGVIERTPDPGRTPLTRIISVKIGKMSRVEAYGLVEHDDPTKPGEEFTAPSPPSVLAERRRLMATRATWMRRVTHGR